MIITYPEFERGQLIEIYDSFSNKDMKTIENYINYRRINSKSESKLKDYRRILTQFGYVTGKEFNKINLNDVRNFLALLNSTNRTVAGKDDVKACIKNFLKYKFKNWSERFENLRDIKTHSRINKVNHKKLNSKELLSKQDIEKLIKTEQTTFWKAFFITLYESGLRPIELRLLKWKDIDFNIKGEITELNIFATKTGRSRPVYVKESTFYLKKLNEIGQGSDFVFPSPKDVTKPLSKTAPEYRLIRLSENALGKRTYPYIFRHSRATELYKLANENKIAKDSAIRFLGHSEDMSHLYTHLDKTQIKDILTKQIYNFDEMPEERKHELEQQVEFLTSEITKIKQQLNIILQK